MPLRSLLVVTSFWEQCWRRWVERPAPRGRLRLPPVFCVVLYTANVVWGSNTNIRELLDEPVVFHPFAPDWGPVLWNLAERTPEQLLAGGPWLQLMAVMRMTDAEQAAFERVYTAAVEHLRAMQQTEPVRWSELLGMILTYARWRRPLEERDTLLAIVQRENPARYGEVQAVTKTWAEAELEERLEERLAERLAEHLTEHTQQIRLEQVQRLRRLLLSMLRKWFDPLPESLVQQIESTTDVARLEAAFDRVPEAIKLGSLEGFQL
jgi:hypothetical protein